MFKKEVTIHTIEPITFNDYAHFSFQIPQKEWIEVDLGTIVPIHGVATQGHGVMQTWVTQYKIAISIDGINFAVLKNSTTNDDLVCTDDIASLACICKRTLIVDYRF